MTYLTCAGHLFMVIAFFFGIATMLSATPGSWSFWFTVYTGLVMSVGAIAVVAIVILLENRMKEVLGK